MAHGTIFIQQIVAGYMHRAEFSMLRHCVVCGIHSD